jgi:hypothetical protein
LIANPCAPIEGSELRAAPRAQLSQPLVVAGCTRGLGCPNIQGFILITTARGQIILTCSASSNRKAGAFSEPFASAVHGVCSKKELADRGLDLIRPDSSSEDRRDDA